MSRWYSALRRLARRRLLRGAFALLMLLPAAKEVYGGYACDDRVPPPCQWVATVNRTCTTNVGYWFWPVWQEALYRVDRYTRSSPYAIYFTNKSRIGNFTSGIGPAYWYDCSQS